MILTIEFVAKTHIRKEDLVKKVLDKRGTHPGLVHIISAMEACGSYKPWHDKQTNKQGKPFLKAHKVNACTIIFISSTHIWDMATYVFQHGVPSNCRFTLTGIIF